MAYPSLHSSASISSWGVNQRWICWHPHISINISIIRPWKIHFLWKPWGWMLSTTLGHIMWIMCFLLLHHSCSFVQVSGRKFVLLILVAPCWMEVPWLPTVLSMLEDIPHQCPIIIINNNIWWFGITPYGRCFTCIQLWRDVFHVLS